MSANPQRRKTQGVEVIADRRRTVETWNRSTRNPVSIRPTMEKMLSRDALAVAAQSEKPVDLAKPYQT